MCRWGNRARLQMHKFAIERLHAKNQQQGYGASLTWIAFISTCFIHLGHIAITSVVLH